MDEKTALSSHTHKGKHHEHPWLEGINAAQKAAIEYLHGPLLVVSGAGTGKTLVLTRRIANLIASDIAKPWNILAVTFTNKAAQEMKSRVAAIIGDAATKDIWFGTFHSLSARFLRRHAECVGLTPGFTILDADDQSRLIKQLLEDKGLDPKRYPPRTVKSIIERWKDKGLTPEKVSEQGQDNFTNIVKDDIYPRYEERLKQINACDFGGLLLHNLTIFQNYPDILAEYHERITHLLVDEYQDTNITQYLWTRLLAGKHNNLCCVGDDDQSIYSWRGAEVTNMLRFEETYPDAKVIRLEQNYRSTGNILASAAAIIANNAARLDKTLHTDAGDGEKVRVSGFWDAAGEARNISERIDSLIRTGEAEYGDIAVLVRTNAQTREIEERFNRAGVPYRVIGAKFYERQEIRDAIAYLRLIAQPADDLAFGRIINTPKRGIGNTTVDLITKRSTAIGMPMLTTAMEMVAGTSTDDGLKPGAKRNLTDVVTLFGRWRQRHLTLAPEVLLHEVLEESGYMDFWRGQRTPDAEGRIGNLEELINALAEFANLEEFLEHIALIMDADNVGTSGAVMLMTLHASKGLEFDTVFAPGWEEGLFPSERSVNEKGGSGLEEERRLAYVGITRARRRLYISWASSRSVHGRWQSRIASRFIRELPRSNIIVESEQDGPAHPSGGMNNRFGRLTSAYDNPAGTDSEYQVKDRVHHDKFGNGNILMIDSDRLTIAFDKAGEKRVISSFVSLVRKGG